MDIKGIDDNVIILGLTGPFGSGCSTIAKILSDDVSYRERQKYNFEYVKTSDILKEEAARREIDIDKMDAKKRRETLQDIGNDMRKEKGPGILVRMAIEKAKLDKKMIILESIKNPGEVVELKKYPNAYVMAVDAPYDIRWKRVKDIYSGDQSQFDIDNSRDRNEEVLWGQNVQKCVDLADIFITNEKIKETKYEWGEFEESIDRYIELIKQPGSHEPTTMELMMNNAYCTSLLSTCIKRQVGAVITITEVGKQNAASNSHGQRKQKQSSEFVIATGYNAVPEGELCCEALHGDCYRDIKLKESLEKLKYCPNCAEKISNKFICPNCKSEFKKFHPSKSLDLCRSLHAEETAILQTARLGGGVSLIGSTLYTTTFPCLLCANKVLASGIEKIIWLEAYPDVQAVALLKGASERGSVEMIEFEGVKAEAFYKLFNKKNIN